MKGQSRYPNVQKHVLDGVVLDSKAEMNRFAYLKLALKAKQIESLEVHPRIPIIIKGVAIKMRSAGYPNGRQVTYVADFKYYDKHAGRWVLEDVKMASGHRTEVYKLKKALVEAMGITITET